tara:strand:- start:1398 stop:1655 length:258 start_codon:yes stop_codon:yes gene_type:complete
MILNLKKSNYGDQMADKIDPKHYNVFKIQPRDYITSNNLGYNEGNIIKYVTRWKLKNGIEDLKKAKNYIDYLIKDAEDKQKDHKQ